MIKLYQFPISHYCEKIRWALDYKSIQYEKINLLPGLHIKKTKKLAKYSSVPVLVDGDKVIQNSAEIISYLDAKNDKKCLTPDDEFEKKQALEWEEYLDKELGPHVRCVCYHILLDHPDVVIPFFTHQGPWYGKLFLKFGFKNLQSKMRHFMKINEKTAKESLIKIEKAIKKINEQLKQTKFLAGEKFSRADLTAASLLAPLCQPAGYGLEWPEKTPKELLAISNKLKKEIEWVDEVYKQYR